MDRQDVLEWIAAIAIVVGVVLVIAVVLHNNPIETTNVINNNWITWNIYKHCEDGIICYHVRSPYEGRMECFRDEDLVMKYCGAGE